MLNPDDSREVSSYLEEALTLTDEGRVAFLASVQRSNPKLGVALKAALAEHRTLVNEEPVKGSRLRKPRPAGLAGQTIGAYTLLSEIGRGGMGTVWLAERSDGRFERQVAVKFLNPAVVGPGDEERFKHEGMISGRLAHPNIAELLDAGVSSSGQPYLVLEYVEGEHIDEYCDGRTLTVKARLRLFLDVLAAVAHAHSNLIVHRDIKPSNVLVTNDGRVKLLDFGIAKLLEHENAGGTTTLLTAEGGSPMTPEYAAPEQLTGGVITTATDVYGLGVLLYVSLTGQHPAGTSLQSHADLIKAIVETEPARPSEIVASTRLKSEITTRNAAKRGTTADKLHRLLRGDLDTIVTKSLKKDPQERYASVGAVAVDLRRYLRNEPISARPDTIAYRAIKFARRHRTAVALAMVAVVATVAGLVGTLVQARTARMQRDLALRQLLRREAVDEFNEFLLSDAAPSGKPFTVDELLGRAESVLARQGAADQTNRIDLLISIGDQYSTQDDDAKARRVLEEAYKLSRTSPERSTRAQASCAFAGALARDGELTRAESLFRQGLDELPAEPQYVMDRILCLRRGSEVAQQRGDSQAGIARIEQAQRIARTSPFDSGALELHIQIELAEAYRMAGRTQQAAVTFEEASKLLSSLGRDNTQTAVALFNDWGLALDRLGRPLEAEKLFRRAIDISRAGDTEETVSPILLNNYAKTLHQLGRLNEAADYAERAHAKAMVVDNQLAIWNSLYVRALIYLDQHDATGAAAMLNQVEPKLRRSVPAGSYWFGALASAQALLAQNRGNLEAASKLSDEAVAMVEAAIKAGEQGSDFLPIALLRRSAVRFEAGRYDDAAADATRALNLLQAGIEPGSSSAYVGLAYLSLGRALQAQGEHSKAHAALQLAAKHLQNGLGVDHPDTRGALMLAAAN